MDTEHLLCQLLLCMYIVNDFSVITLCRTLLPKNPCLVKMLQSASKNPMHHICTVPIQYTPQMLNKGTSFQKNMARKL